LTLDQPPAQDALTTFVVLVYFAQISRGERMSKWMVIAVFLCSGLAAACGGGGSGVSGSTQLGKMSDADITKLCEYLVDLAGPARTITCSNGETIMTGGGSAAECATDFKESRTEFPNCSATVSNLENCFEDIADFSDQEICSDSASLPDSCLPLLSASCGGL
jgi:hypothetical protein